MKIIVKAFLIFLVLNFISSRGDPKDCTHLIKKKGDDVKAIDNANDVFPADFQDSGKALDNGKSQTTTARNFFSKMGLTARTIIGEAAKKFSEIYSKSSELRTIIVKNEELSRQAKTGGTGSYGDWNGILTDIKKFTDKEMAAFESKAKALTEAKDANLDKDDFLNHAIAITQFSSATPKDLLGLIGLLGDVGACIQDYYNRPAPDVKDTEKHNEWLQKKTIAEVFAKAFPNLESQSKKAWKTKSPDNYYDDKTDSDPTKHRTKQGDRLTCSAQTTGKGSFKWVARAGVLNLAASSPGDLPLITWPMQTVPSILTAFCPDEPWAGHFSGSLYEILLMLDILIGKDPNANIVATDKKEMSERRAIAAIAGGFLVATGMHSSVEVIYVIKNYLGNPVKKEELLSDKVCSGATTFLNDILSTNTDKRKRIKRNKKLK